MKKEETKEVIETKETTQEIRKEKILGALFAIIVLLIVTLFASVYTFFFSGKYLLIKKTSLDYDVLEDFVHSKYDEDFFDSEYIDESLIEDEEEYDEGEFLYDGAPIDSELISQ